MGRHQISRLILLVAVLLAPLSHFLFSPNQSLFVLAHPVQQDEFLKPQAPHFHNGGHEESYIPTSLSEVDSVAELSEYCWQGGEYSGEDIWMKRLPIWEPNDQFPKGRRIGFLLSFANVVVIETSEGLVMLDTSSFMTTHKVKEQIQEWSNQPLHTAVFTHGHFDHVFGVDLWEEEQNELRKQAPSDDVKNSIPARVSVVAHRKVVDRFERYKKTLPYNSRINSRQFESEADALFEFPTDFRYPDVLYDRTLTLRVGEEVLELHHAKGETDDATWIWLPERRTVCTGDLFIWHSPNAGNPQKVQRYPAEWAQALREMAALHPRTLLPGHGPPIVGEERVKQALENTANLLEFLVEHTVELMNKGLSLNEIIHTIKVPQEWLDLPYLRPRYDEPEFVINNIWRLYGGWWSLNYAELKPAPRPDLARELSALVGGSRVLVRRALELAAKEEFRLAGHLAQFAIDADPADPEVLKAYSEIFLARAQHPSTTSSMARGIFTAASKHYGVIKGADSTEGEADQSDLGFLDWLRSIFSSILNLGRRNEENILPKQVSVKQLNFQWLETVSRPLNFSAVAPEFQHFANLAEETSSIFEKFIDEEGEEKGGPWSVQKESEGVVTEMREMSDIEGGWSFLAIRGTGEIPFSPREVAAFVLDPAHRYKWDPRNKEETTLAQISPCLYLKYHLVPGKMMVADRDMVYLGYVKHDQLHETYTYSLKSVDYDKAPAAGHNGCVRMQVLGGGLQIRPARNNPEHTEVVFVYVADIGGDIPNAIRRMVGISQTAQIARMREALLP